MTEVVRSNFREIIPAVIEQIEKCTFVAIDAEYTGLFAPNISDANSLFDCPSKRYEKLVRGLANFQISQFGLAVFEKSWDKNEYFVESYNFYLYPVSFYTFRERATFHCQISSLNFLSANHFDFNKFIKEGVPYLRPDEVVALRKYLRKNRYFMTDIENRDKAYFPRYLSQLDDDAIEEIIDNLIGFSKIITAIIRTQKPIVGHNMLMDLTLLYQQFCGVLPETYGKFKAELHELFPIIFDTKHVVMNLRKDILSRPAGKNVADAESMFDTALLTLYKNLVGIKNFFGPFINLKNDSAKYCSEMETLPSHKVEKQSNSHYHEAAFDACVTGAVFVHLSHVAFRQTRRCPNSCIYSTTASELFANLASCQNKINIVRSTASFINLAGDDPTPTRPNWIRVEEVPSVGANLDIQWLRRQMLKYGDVDIETESGNTALIACGGWGCAKNAWTFLTDNGFKVTALEYSTEPYFNPHQVLKVGAFGIGLGVLLIQMFLYGKRLGHT